MRPTFEESTVTPNNSIDWVGLQIDFNSLVINPNGSYRDLTKLITVIVSETDQTWPKYQPGKWLDELLLSMTVQPRGKTFRTDQKVNSLNDERTDFLQKWGA